VIFGPAVAAAAEERNSREIPRLESPSIDPNTIQEEMPCQNRESTCAVCGERVDLRNEHYRMVTQFRAYRAAVHVECYRKMKKKGTGYT